METPGSLAADLRSRLPLTVGTLYFFGDSFGRPGDNRHTLVGARRRPAGYGRRERVVLDFDEGETLTVAEPSGLVVDDAAFEIRDASRVTWRWFSYGLPKTTENLYVLDYRRVGARVVVADTADWHDGVRRRARPGAAAVRTEWGG